MGKKVAEYQGSEPLFNGQYGNHHHSGGFSFYGNLIDFKNQQIPVLVSYNMNYRINIVDLVSGSSDEPLFVSAGPDDDIIQKCDGTF